MRLMLTIAAAVLAALVAAIWLYEGPGAPSPAANSAALPPAAATAAPQEPDMTAGAPPPAASEPAQGAAGAPENSFVVCPGDPRCP